MKTFVIIILTMIFNYSFAQINEESVFIGGNIGGSITNTKKDGSFFSEQKGMTISPVYGKAIKNNLVTGAGLLLEFTNEKFSATTTYQKQRFYGLLFFLRKYKFIGNSSFSIFVEGGLRGEYSPFDQTNTTSLDKQKRRVYIVSLYAYPGVSYKLNRSLHLETGFTNLLYMQYLHQKIIISSSTTTIITTNNFGVGASLDNISPFYIGFRLLINK